jgi:hypothetical protein
VLGNVLENDVFDALVDRGWSFWGDFGTTRGSPGRRPRENPKARFRQSMWQTPKFVLFFLTLAPIHALDEQVTGR